ncbi:MAG TPA: hypothetical protein VJ505_14810 [Holophagaceae bacterium]|nr:hypothetical protein [Geothrix sp.]HJW34614.1 hypothetical protein [Holophagaceae bacterium]
MHRPGAQTALHPDVAWKNLAGFRDFLALDAFTARPEVTHLQTSLIFEFAKGKAMPDYRKPAG